MRPAPAADRDLAAGPRQAPEAGGQGRAAPWWVRPAVTSAKYAHNMTYVRFLVVKVPSRPAGKDLDAVHTAVYVLATFRNDDRFSVPPATRDGSSSPVRHARRAHVTAAEGPGETYPKAPPGGLPVRQRRAPAT